MAVKVRFTYYDSHGDFTTREGELYKVDGSHYHLLDETRNGNPRTFFRGRVSDMEVMAIDPPTTCPPATPTCNELDYAIIFFRK